MKIPRSGISFSFSGLIVKFSFFFSTIFFFCNLLFDFFLFLFIYLNLDRPFIRFKFLFGLLCVVLNFNFFFVSE